MADTRSTGRLGTYLSATTLALSAGVAVISAMPGVSLHPRASFAVMALAAVALTVGVSKLRRDPDGARARAGADVLRGAAVLLGFVTVSVLHRPAAFAPALTPRVHAGELMAGLHAAALSVGLTRLLTRSTGALLGRVTAGLALAALLAVLAASVVLQQRTAPPERFVASMEVFARLPAFRDVPSLRQAEPWMQRVVPLGRFFLLQRCPGARCQVWLAPRIDGDIEPSPSSLPPEQADAVFADHREITVRLDAARDLIALDDGAHQLLFDRETGEARPAGWNQLRPAPAPPVRWTLLGALGWVLALAAAWSSRRTKAVEPVEAELRDDGAVIHQGRAVPLAAPPTLSPGPVLVWLDGDSPVSHYRDARTTPGARMEPGTLTIFRANAISRAVARRSLVTALVFLSVAPFVAWGIAALPRREHPAANTRRRVEDGGLVIEDLRLGTGTEVRSGARVSVHYTGTLTDGHVFDSSRAREPFTFTTGARMVIEGFERGVRGMRVGGRRRLTIPPSLGYGDRGHPPTIPERATLVFDLELLAVN
jgi:FKBP-type peptidyl-prolyl cis-trans isomerase FkpA